MNNEDKDPQNEIIHWRCSHCEVPIKNLQENYTVLSRTIDNVKHYGVVHEKCHKIFMHSFRKPDVEGFYIYGNKPVQENE